jgi:gluconolactonase
VDAARGFQSTIEPEEMNALHRKDNVKSRLALLVFASLAAAACCRNAVKPDDGAAGGPSATPDSLLVPPGGKVGVVGTASYQFLEGPAWDKTGTLFFTDINAGRIYRLRNGFATVFRDRSNASNGLMFDRTGRLIACEGGAGQITALDTATGAVVDTLVSRFGGIRFNSPNDLVIDGRGGIYFTDPTWAPERPQGVEAVYYRAPDGTVTRLISDMLKPNGVQLSPDETVFYVDDSNSLDVRAYDRAGDGSLSNRRTFAVLKTAGYGPATADGMAVDAEGRLYVTTETGVQIFRPDGAWITTLAVPETPANAAFGGPDMKTLYITARTHLYSIRLNAAGLEFPLP